MNLHEDAFENSARYAFRRGDESTFSDSRFAWQDELADEELKQLPIIKAIGQLSYVQSIELQIGAYCLLARDEEHKAIYAKNVEAFRRVLSAVFWQKTTKHYTECYDLDSCFPIYENSRVCGRCSLLHHPDQKMKSFAEWERKEEEEKMSFLKTAKLEKWNDTKDMPKTEESIKMLIEHRPEMVASWILRTREDANKLRRRERRRRGWAKLAKNLFSR